ncbi:tetratricopeptide repeat protein [Candidatus Omnitrophota bacterium]
MQKFQYVLIIIILFTAALACYSSVLNAGFVWDDEFIILRNSLVRAPLWDMQMFKQDIVNSSFTHTWYYRPVQILSYALDYRLDGMNPYVFHFTNLILHFLNGVLVFFLAYKLTGERTVSFITSLIFTIHPAQVSAVSYISGRADLLFFLFGFLFLLFYILFRERKEYGYLAIGVVSLCLSLLSKEAALVFPFLCLLMDLTVLKPRLGFRAVNHLPGFTVAGIYVGLHHLVTGGGHSILSGVSGGFSEKAVQILKTIGEFLVLGVFPYGLSMRHGVAAIGGNVFLALAILVIMIAVFIYLKDRWRVLLFASGFFLIALLPFLIVTASFDVFAEHWMYLAGFGLFLFISSGLVWICTKWRPIGKGIVLVILYAGIVFYSGSTMSMNRHWVDDVTLSDRILGFSERDAVAMHYKAVALLKSGEEKKSLDIMEDLSAHHPEDARAWYLKGRLNLAAGNKVEAEEAFKRALKLTPGYDNAYVGLALTALADNREKEGIEYIGKALDVNPRHPEAILFLCMAFSRSGDPAKAVMAAEKARETYPYNYDILVNLGTAYTRAGRIQEGARMYLEASRLYPEEPMPYFNLGYLFYASGQKEEARRWLREAIMVDPDYSPAVELLKKIREEEN